MNETNWIGKSGGKVSDPANWDNGVPDHRTKAIFDVSERTEITWDLIGLGIPVDILCDPEDVVIYISGDCLVGGSYFVPDAIQDHFEAFKDESLNPDVLDRPPPGYGMFNQTTYTWNNAHATAEWEDGRNWGQMAPGSYPKNKNHKAVFDNTSDDPCATTGAVTIGELDMQSGYDGTLTLDGNFTVDDSGPLDGHVTITTNSTLSAASYTIALDGNWSNSGTFTCGTSTVNLTGSTAQSITSGGDAFYNLTISNTGSVDINIIGDLDVDSAFNCSSTTNTLRLNTGMSPPDVNTAGNVTFANGFSVTKGTGTWTFDGTDTQTYTDNNIDTVINIGNIAITYSSGTPILLLASHIWFVNITINASTTFNAGGTYPIYVNGDWSNSGTFTYSTSTVHVSGSTAQKVTIGYNYFYNLTISNTHGSAKVEIDGQLDLVNDFALKDGILDIGTNDPVVKTRGDITIYSNCTIDITNRTALWWIVGETQNYSDGHDSDNVQNIGNIIISCSEPPNGDTLLTLDDHIRFNNLTIWCEDNTLDASENGINIYCEGYWKNGDNSQGVFIYGTSHVHFEGTSTITGMTGGQLSPTNRFYDVTIKSGRSASTQELIDYNSIGGWPGCLTRGFGTSGDTTYVHDLIVNGTFTVSSDQVDGVCP